MRYNTSTRASKTVVNYEGARAFAMTPEFELYSAVVTWSLSDTYYEASDDRGRRIRTLIERCDPVFVGQLAVYVRTTMNMRSVTLQLVAELARTSRGTDLVSRVTNKVIRRADEITELLACYALMNGRTSPKKLGRLSKQVQKGLSMAFNSFDEYQFAKYDRKAEITLRDALFLVHPKPKDVEQQSIFDKIATGSLATPYTWETELSMLGQAPYETPQARSDAFTAKWEELIDSNKLGYMALLRNLRNIVQAGVSGVHIEKVCSVLADPKKVAQSKQFPFRFLSAYRELQQLGEQIDGNTVVDRIFRAITGDRGLVGGVLDALEQAVAASALNVQGFDSETRVLIACDVSGSMQTPVSPKSTVNMFDIGLVLGMMLRSRCKRAEIGMFGDTWKVINVPATNILANVQAFYAREGEVGYATNGHLVIRDLVKRRVVMDKVMIFTDCQMWDTSRRGSDIQTAWLTYRRDVAPDARLYLFDLAGHGQSPVNLLSDGVSLIAGWSEKVFEVLAAIEHGGATLDMIRKTELN